MKFPSFKYCPEAILAIPKITWGLRFHSEKEWEDAAYRLVGKVTEFPEKVFQMTRPISGQYLHDYWGVLCEELDLFMVSLAFLGKDHRGRMFPESTAPSGDSKPDWKSLDFEMIRSAESLYQYCRDKFTRYFKGTENKQSILEDLGTKIERFAGAEGRDDIGHLYYLLYLEMVFTLDVLYPHSHMWSELIWGVGQHPEHWFKLRSGDFGVLPIMKTRSDKELTEAEAEGDLQPYGEYREEAKNIARELYVGESPKPPPYDNDYSKGIPSQTAESSATPIGSSFTDSDTSKIIDHQFIQKGDYWDIVWQGKQTHLAHLNGLTCIHMLLSNPRKPISVQVIYSVFRPESKGKKIPTFAGEKSQLKLSKPNQRENAASNRNLEEIQDALASVEEELNLPDVTPERKDELELLVSTAKEQLRLAQNPQGQLRVDDPQLEKARDNVRKAIDRALKKIAKDLPDMAWHLRKEIELGYMVQYRGDIEWWLR